MFSWAAMMTAVLLFGCAHAPANVHPAASNARRLPAAGLEQLHMVTARAGWAVAENRYGQPAGIVRTIDGGRTWHRAGPAWLARKKWQVTFATARLAWMTVQAAGLSRPAVYRTGDAGRTWTRMGAIGRAASSAPAPDMLTRRLGWVGLAWDFGMGKESYAIYRSTDGGHHWSLAELTTPNRRTPGAIPGGCGYDPPVFVSAATGWVTGACISTAAPQLWVSHDGGRAWHRQPLPRPSGAGMLTSCQCSVVPPVFVSAQFGVLLVSLYPPSGPGTDVAYVTGDGGRAWRPMQLPGRMWPASVPDFVTPRTGFVLGARGAEPAAFRLLATSDGGATWAVRSTLPQGTSLDFVTRAVGFATVVHDGRSGAYLLQTTDGGLRWVRIPARLAMV